MPVATNRAIVGLRLLRSFATKVRTDSSVCTNSSTGHPFHTTDSRCAGPASSSTVTSRSDVGVAPPDTTDPDSHAWVAAG